MLGHSTAHDNIECAIQDKKTFPKMQLKMLLDDSLLGIINITGIPRASKASMKEPSYIFPR